MKIKCLYIIALCTFFVYPCLFAACNDEEENDEINLASDFFSQSVWEGELRSEIGNEKFTIAFLSDTTADARIDSKDKILHWEYTINGKLLDIRRASPFDGEWLLINHNKSLDELEFMDRFYYGGGAATKKIKKTY